MGILVVVYLRLLAAWLIGSSAQCNGMKVYCVGIKNLPTQLVSSSSALSVSSNYKLLFLNVMFYQDHLHISPVETSLVSLLFFRNFNLALERIKSIIKRINAVNGGNITKLRYALPYHLSIDTLYLYYAILTSKADFTRLFIRCWFLNEIQMKVLEL